MYLNITSHQQFLLKCVALKSKRLGTRVPALEITYVCAYTLHRQQHLGRRKGMAILR
jgi:hypothetical protein